MWASSRGDSQPSKQKQKQNGEWLGVSFKPENFIPGMVIGFILGMLLDLAKPTKSSASSKNIGSSLMGKGYQQQNLASVSSDEELKMVLVVRQDLKMGPGKIASQCARKRQLIIFNSKQINTITSKWGALLPCFWLLG